MNLVTKYKYIHTFGFSRKYRFSLIQVGFCLQIKKGTKSKNTADQEVFRKKPAMGCAAKRKATENTHASLNEKRLKSFKEKTEQMRRHCAQMKKQSSGSVGVDMCEEIGRSAGQDAVYIIDQVVSQTVSDAFVSCELSSLDASITFMEEPVTCHKAKFRGNDQPTTDANIPFMEEPLTCHKAKIHPDHSITCDTLTELSTIHMLSDRECTVREQNSCCIPTDGPLHSSIRYPQFSTPSQNQDVDGSQTLKSGCVDDLIFNEVSSLDRLTSRPSRSNVTVKLVKSSFTNTKESKSKLADGNTPKGVSRVRTSHYTLDSDNTAFLSAPMCKKAVTYKMKSSRKAVVKNQLRTFGRQIRTLGAGRSKIQTLAIL